MRRLRAIGRRAIVAALDADRHEETSGGVRYQYEVDPQTGLAMAAGYLLPHCGVVVSVGADVPLLRPQDVVVMQRAREGHREVFRFEGLLLQVVDGETPALWIDGAFSAPDGRVLVERASERDEWGAEVDVTAGSVWGRVMDSGLDGVDVGDRAWWARTTGTTWAAEGRTLTSLREEDVLCVVGGDDAGSR